MGIDKGTIGAVIVGVVACAFMYNTVYTGFDKCLVQPQENLKWVNMTLIDKQIVVHNSLFGSHNQYCMIFNSSEYGVMTYSAMNVSEYAMYNVGQTCPVGINNYGIINAAHKGDEYGQLYKARARS